jgi:hypothetical protein
MAELETGRFTCSGCGKSYRWKPQIAGKRATCKQCQRELTVPGAPGVAAATFAAEPVAVGSSGAAAAATPAPGISPIMRALESREDERRSSPVRELYAPLILGLLGLCWMTAYAYAVADAWPWRAAALGIVLGGALLNVPLLFGAIMVTAHIAQMGFGDLVPGLIKIVGVALFGSIGADVLVVNVAPLMLEFGYYGIVAATGLLFASNLLLVALPLWVLFEMDLQEFGVTAVAVFVIKVVLLGVLLAMLPA